MTTTVPVSIATAAEPARASGPSSAERPEAAGNAGLERKVVANARRFHIIALLELIADLGYRHEEILFESHYTTASQPALIEAVEFRSSPSRQAIITLNIGLLGPLSPLPTYFNKVMDSGDIDEESFLAFLKFFDHVILERFLASLYPERDPSIYKDFEATKRGYLKLMGLGSVSTLHWLFQLAFPEVEVRVARATGVRDLRVDGVRLGASKIGDGCALGGRSNVKVPGFDVTLTVDEDSTGTGRPWAEEIRRRLAATVFPVLCDHDVDLRISLVIRSQRGFAQLHKGVYLGFDHIRGGKDVDRVVKIHAGLAR